MIKNEIQENTGLTRKAIEYYEEKSQCLFRKVDVTKVRLSNGDLRGIHKYLNGDLRHIALYINGDLE